MIISIVGPRQSGSTLLFNLVQIILKFAGNKDVYSAWYHKRNEDLVKNAHTVIYKVHGFTPELLNISDVILLPIRDVRDCISSAKKRWPNEMNTIDKIIHRVSDDIQMFNDWKPYANYIFRYEAYRSNPVRHIVDIAKAIGIDKPLFYGHIHDESNQLYNDDRRPKKDDFKNEFYRKTLLTKSHNTSNGVSGHYKTNFNKEELSEINKVCEELIEYNYEDNNSTNTSP